MSDNWNAHTEQALEIIPKGAFLTVQHEEKRNTMTIGWGSFGFAWGKPIFTVMVRPSRYTYDLIEKSGEFTVSLPTTEAMKQALVLCGTKSGRDINKFDAAGITTIPGQNISTPIINCTGIHYECKIVYKQPMSPDSLDAKLQSACYPASDYHTLYYGEILAVYQK